MKNELLIYDMIKGYITFSVTDEAEIFERLAHDLIAKKMHKCLYIRKITDQSLYNGYRKITVYYDNHCKAVYTIKF